MWQPIRVSPSAPCQGGSGLTCCLLRQTLLCSLQGLMTTCFTAIRLIWKYVTFLEKMSQNYRGERWNSFIKLASPSFCQSMAVPYSAYSQLCCSDVFKVPCGVLLVPALGGSFQLASSHVRST